jgi:hypothetical protein
MSKDDSKEYFTSEPVEVCSGTTEDGAPGLWKRVKSKAALQVSDSRMAPGTRWSNKGDLNVPPLCFNISY